jgi:hypothetical protein
MVVLVGMVNYNMEGSIVNDSIKVVDSNLGASIYQYIFRDLFTTAPLSTIVIFWNKLYILSYFEAFIRAQRFGA